MFKNTPFEAIAKSMTDAAPKFNPAAVQDAIKPAQDNLKAWADLAQSQAKEAQAVLTETVESMKAIKEEFQQERSSDKKKRSSSA